MRDDKTYSSLLSTGRILDVKTEDHYLHQHIICLYLDTLEPEKCAEGIKPQMKINERQKKFVSLTKRLFLQNFNHLIKITYFYNMSCKV